MLKVHNFQEYLDIGEGGERELDEHYSQWYYIEPTYYQHDATVDLQRLGIDRIFTSICDGRRITVEYKVDKRSGDTGNAFIETISNDKNGKLGWGYTCCAQVVVYYTPHDGTVYMLDALKLKDDMGKAMSCFSEVPAQNENYRTFGRKVPLDVLKKLARGTFKIGQKNDKKNNLTPKVIVLT